MKIKLNHKFEKSYKARISLKQKLVLQTKERINLFIIDAKNPIQKDHGLSGAKRKLRAFSVTGDIRIIFFPVLTYS